MRKLGLLLITGATLVLGLTAGTKGLDTSKEERDTRIIVEVSNSLKVRAGQGKVDKQNLVINSIRHNVTSNFSVKERYSAVTNAFVMDVNSNYVEDIKNIPGVLSVSEDTFHTSKELDGEVVNVPLTTAGSTSVENISATTMNKPDDTNEGEGVVIAILDTSYLLTHETFADLDSSVSVALTKEEASEIVKGSSFHGQPDATHTTYWNNKVPFYYDYGGTTNKSGQPGSADYDVFSELSDHGQHVASTAAGSSIANFEGIAPKAQLLLMKVFTDYYPTAEDAAKGYTARTGAYDSVILKAFEDAALLGADIASLSLGSDLGDFNSDSLLMKTIEKLQKNGMFIDFAAGNSGKLNYSKAGSYANWTTNMTETGILSDYVNSEYTMGIAAGVPTKMYYETAVIVNGSTISYEDQITDYKTSSGDVTYEPNRNLTDITNDGEITEFGWVKVPGWGEASDYDDIDVSGKIAVIDRGETTFLSKITTAVNKGAIAVFIINNDPSETDFTFRMDLSGNTPSVPVCSLLYRDRDTFLKSGNSGTLSILADTEAEAPNAYMITDFSSDGAAYDLALKPEITAPGQSIKGAVYTDSNGVVYEEDGKTVATDQYGYYSGTSMATPNYSGALAVILSEHATDADYRKTLNMRTMSTATLMYDEIEKESAELTSPRLQGAGMVNIANAIDTQVYLEGLNQAGTAGIGKAKIQLYNNEDIAKGDVKLSFIAHNESSSTKTYEATTYIYRPELVTLNEDNYPQYKGVEFMSVQDTLIEKVTQEVSIPAGESTIKLNTYSLTDTVKAELDSKFENGCVIEGFVVLEEKNSTDAIELSIPYLGFYGDYSKGIPVEEFDFEQDPTKTYASDILNDLASVAGYSSADYTSGWVVGYAEDMEDVSIENCLLNTTNIFRLNGYKSIGTNPYTGEVDPNNLYVGNNGKTNTMIIQQMVLRSVKDNTITLTNTETGKVVLVDHMFDSLFGDDEASTHPLYKSHVSADYISSGILAHRAYSIIPLYNIDTGELYPDGEYEMKFEYELAAGGTYTKTYTLHIDSVAPELHSLESLDNGETIRVRYDEVCLSYVTVNGRKYEVSHDDKGYYVDIKKADVSNTKIMVKATDMAYGVSTILFNKDDISSVAQSDSLSLQNNMTVTATNKTSATDLDVTIEITNKQGKVVTPSSFTFLYKLPSNGTVSNIELYEVTSSGEKAVSFTYEDGYVKFETGGHFHIKWEQTGSSESSSSSSSDSGSSTTPGKKGGCGGSIIATSSIIAAFSLLGVGIVLLKKKEK